MSDVLSFSRLSLFAGCPLRFRYLEVERRPEPHVPPDWRRAPAKLPPLAVASAFDRSLGVAVHIALARWQRAVEGGA
ncbi:MAG: PD-(D/E)XK nuclease family protein, partial [Candidatus Dormibacteria bacterium]